MEADTVENEKRQTGDTIFRLEKGQDDNNFLPRKQSFGSRKGQYPARSFGP